MNIKIVNSLSKKSQYTMTKNSLEFTEVTDSPLNANGYIGFITNSYNFSIKVFQNKFYVSSPDQEINTEILALINDIQWLNSIIPDK